MLLRAAGARRLRYEAVGMVGKIRLSRWVIGAVILAAVECAGLMAVQFAVSTAAQAQSRDDRFPFLHRQRSGSGGFFGDLFGNPGGYRRSEPQFEQSEQNHSRAPSPHKPNKDVVPTTSVVVIGDGMADWLAYGLEDAFADQPEVAIDRQNKYNSGLLRYDPKGDLDWWHVTRDILTKEKANYVVMMLGVSDRENIREKDLAKEAEKQKAENPQGATKPADQGTAPDKPQADNQSIAAPEPKSKTANGGLEFHTDQWAAVYSRRVDDTIAALKSKGVPVFWVGLPSIRGTKSTADSVYLNDLYRARAERAGIVYIDVWDGFVDEGGKYSTFGPDYEGQIRRLRSGDGVYFTKFGARKLAHYVEREIRRYMSNRVPVALPNAPIAVPQSAGKSAARPLAGPVVPLTVITNNADQLLGGAGTRPTYGDATATDVLVKGEPVNAPRGRADDFNWQGGESSGAAPAAQTPGPAAALPAAAVPAAAMRQVEPAGANAPQTKAAAKPALPTAVNTKPVPPAPVQHNPPPPKRRSTFQFSNPLGWLR
jgi:hypothetical protein